MIDGSLRAVLLSSKRKFKTGLNQQLIISDEYMYPPIQRDIKEVLISQYVTALQDQAIFCGNDDRIDKKHKFPLPIVFAFLHHHLQHQKYEHAIRLLLNNIQRKMVENGHIITYIISKIYWVSGEYKKCVFYLQNLLKQDPFFSQAIFDLCVCYADQFNRETQALKILERHLGENSSNNKYAQSLYLKLSGQNNKNLKDVGKVLHGKTMSLSNYYNLGIFCKRIEQLDKAEEIFTDIINKLSKAKEDNYHLFTYKDHKIFILSKINLFQILQKQMEVEFNQQNLYNICQSLLQQHKKDLNQQSIHKIQATLQLLGEEEKYGALRHLSLTLRPINKKYIQQTTEVMKGSTKINKQNISKINSFNQQFSNFRQYNNKKLKYLLIKQKQINNFFKNLIIKKKPNDQQYKIIYKQRDRTDVKLVNESLAKKAKIQLNQQEIQLFQKQFEDKRKVHQFKYNNIEIQDMLGEIITNLENLKKTNNEETQITNKIVHNSKYAKVQQKHQKTDKIKMKTSNSCRTLKSDRSQNNFRIKQASAAKQNLKPSTKFHPNVQNTKGPQNAALNTPTSPQTEQSQKPISTINFVQNQIKQKNVNNSNEPKYDPLMSSFQLTGFDKGSLGKFMNIKAKKSLQKRSSNFNFPKPDIKEVRKEIDVVKTQFQLELQKGYALEKEQKFDEAYEVFTNMYKKYKQQSQKQEVLIKIGALFQKQQKNKQAEKTYMKCTKFNNVQAFLKLGSLLLKNGRIKSGVQNLQKANCIKRYDIQIQNKLVYGYSLNQQTMDKALTLAHNILKKQPQSLETLIMTANILQKQGKVKQAIQIVTAIDKFKQTEYIKHYLGILYLQDSNLTQAFNYFKAALNIKPDHIPSLIQVATIISDLSPKQSISILQKVIQIQPTNRKALARLGKIYQTFQNDFQNAMLIYKTALQTQQNYESYMKIGDCFAKKQSYIEALLNYKQGLNMKKTHEAYAKIASMFQKKSEYIKAIENYQFAIDLLANQKDMRSFNIRYQYLKSLGKLNILVYNYDAAIASFEQVLEQDESIQIFKLLAEAQFGKKQYTTALQYYQKANDLAKGEDIDVLQCIAMCFDKMEEYLASKAIYEKILQKRPENVKCMNNLANILLITGQTNQAFYLFESLLQKVPKNLQKRLKVADIYAEVGDWSKVEYHLLQCYRQKQFDSKILQKLISLYKEKRDTKQVAKYQKKLALIKASHKHHKQN